MVDRESVALSQLTIADRIIVKGKYLRHAKPKKQLVPKESPARNVEASQFEKLVATRDSQLQIGAGGNSTVVCWRIEHGLLPGFLRHKEARMEVSNLALDDVPNEVLWQGNWLDVAKVLAREVADKEDDSVAFAILDQDELLNHHGNFKPAPNGWVCFDYPFYMVVRKVEPAYTACLMRRLY